LGTAIKIIRPYEERPLQSKTIEIDGVLVDVIPPPHSVISKMSAKEAYDAGQAYGDYLMKRRRLKEAQDQLIKNKHGYHSEA
jgi:hypothetical protein